MMDYDENGTERDSKFRHEIEVMTRALSALAKSCIEDEGCDPVSVAKAARDISFVAAECLRPSLHYKFIKDWEGVADRSVRSIVGETRKRNKLLESVEQTGAGH